MDVDEHGLMRTTHQSASSLAYQQYTLLLTVKHAIYQLFIISNYTTVTDACNTEQFSSVTHHGITSDK